MRIANIIIGEKFRYAHEFVSYMQRRIVQEVSKIDNTIYFRDNDPSILQELQSIIEKYDITIISTSKQSWPVVSKSLATRLEDNLVQKDGMLIPSKCTNYSANSFRIELKGRVINVIKIDELEKIPDILITNMPNKITFNVLNPDLESVKLMINPLSVTNDISVVYSKDPGGFVRCDAAEGKYGNLGSFIQNAQNLLPSKIAVGGDLGMFLIEELSKYNMTLSVAESCTGGLASYQFTKHAGSSSVFLGSMISYANEIKSGWLGVGQTDLTKYGAVSEEVVSAMLDGVMNASNSHFSIAISGIAGPDGGSLDKPIGTVFVGVKHQSGLKNIEALQLSGDRNLIQIAASNHALRMLSELFLQNF